MRHTYHEAAQDFQDNPGQVQAYNSTGNCVILAGPGSGKTKTLTVKMARILAEDVKAPRGVACITYSVECASELQRRLGSLGVEESRRVFIGTVHSFCFRQILLPFGHIVGLNADELAVASESEQDRLFAQAVADVLGVDESPRNWRLRCDKYRRVFLDKKTEAFLQTDESSAQVILKYELLLRQAALIDFDGMVLEGLRLVEEHEWVRAVLRARFPVLVVDEYQDLGTALHRMVLSLCFSAGIRLLAVGDQDQSIYGFTGACPELLAELSHFGAVQAVTLPFNYRCGQTIVGVAETALGNARGYQSKAAYSGTIIFHECEDGLKAQAELICQSIIPEALARNSSMTLDQIGLLYVDKNDGDVIAAAATTARIKYVRVDRGAPFRRSHLVRWLEGCAAWSSTGWEAGASFSRLMGRWLSLYRRGASPTDLREKRAELVRFLFTKCDPNTSLVDWLTALEQTSFRVGLEREPAFADELEEFDRLKTTVSKEGKLPTLTVGEFCRHTRAHDHLNLVTLHSAKGLEFEIVILMGMDQGRIPNYRLQTVDAKREPRRLFYVGLTRAKREVHMTYSAWYEAYGRLYADGASEFLLEVKAKLTEAA
jgi:DNA helicase II / ATP-dependent DNA helicase PcrA